MRNELWYNTLSAQTDATIVDVGLDRDADQGSFEGDVMVVDGCRYSLPQPGSIWLEICCGRLVWGLFVGGLMSK